MVVWQHGVKVQSQSLGLTCAMRIAPTDQYRSTAWGAGRMRGLRILLATARSMGISLSLEGAPPAVQRQVIDQAGDSLV